MKKITLKISAFLLFTMSALQVQSQTCPEIYMADGSYKISTCGLSPELYMTIKLTGGIDWQEELPGDDPLQVWTIQDHPNPASGGYISITADLSSFGAGTWSMYTDAATLDGSGTDPEVQITVLPGGPISDVMDPSYGFDQFQRRRESGWGGPGNNALFAKPNSPPNQGNLRYRDAPTAAGDPVLFQSGGAISPLRLHLVSLLSNESFDANSVFISNPVNNEITVKGLTSNVKQVSVYSLLGKRMLSKELNDDSTLKLDVSAFTSGMYILDFKGDNLSFSKKIIKQ